MTNTTPNAPDLPGHPGRALRPAEAAEYLQITERYLRRLCTERRITVIKIGRQSRFRVADLDAFLRANRRVAR